MESKDPNFGGIEGAVLPEPEITELDIDATMDFVFLGCDGIYDVLSNEEVNQVIWETINYHKQKTPKKNSKIANYKKNKQNTSCSAYGELLDDCVNNVLKKSLLNNSEDNVTAILVAFKNLLED